MKKKKEIDWTNFEKVLMGTSLVAVVSSLVYVYLTTHLSDGGMVSLVGVLVGGLIARKGLSYFKPERYRHNEVSAVEPMFTNENNDENGSV